MSVYKETDGSILREYRLESSHIQTNQTDKALFEMVSTKEYGSVLFLDNVLQFAQKDEYIYHEMLVHPCLSTSKKRDTICIIGGGDGCAAREVLKWKDVTHIDLYDWDKEITDRFSKEHAWLNMWSLQNPHVHIYNQDIRSLVEKSCSYDCIIVDLLDPDDSQGELWNDILSCLNKWIRPGGSIVINAGGITPWNTTSLNWLLQQLQVPSGFYRHLYKVFVPSFGKEWCFLLINQQRKLTLDPLPPSLDYLDEVAWNQAYTYGWTKNYRKTVQGLFC
jgi:spermidine synthase